MCFCVLLGVFVYFCVVFLFFCVSCVLLGVFVYFCKEQPVVQEVVAD